MAPKPVVKERQRVLLALREVGSWNRDHASHATARTQLDQLELFCRRTETEPLKLLALAKSDLPSLRDLVQGYISGQQREGRSSRYALNVWWGVRSFLAYHDAAPNWTPKLKPVASDDTSETVPTTEQMRGILNALPPRGRAAALLLASSGIRIGVLANQDGPVDGLRLKHLPDLELRPEPHFSKTPFLIRVPPHLAKGSTVARPRGYLTFGSTEAAEALVTYFQVRRDSGENLDPESPVITADGRGARADARFSKDGMRFMARKTLGFSLRTAMEKVAPEEAHWHAHTLRAWFSTQMETAEARGLISRSRREFFMGHVGLGVDFDYNLDRPKSAEKVDELRASYQRCEPLLSVNPTRSEKDVQAGIAKVMLMGMGYTDEELSGVNFDELDVATFQNLVQQKMVPAEPAERPKQRLVGAKELASFLAEGWTVVTTVGPDQVVLNPP